MNVQQENGLAKQDSHQTVNVQSVLVESGRLLLASLRTPSVPICVLLGNGRLKQDSHRTVSAPIVQLERSLILEKANRPTFAKSVATANTCQSKHLYYALNVHADAF